MSCTAPTLTIQSSGTSSRASSTARADERTPLINRARRHSYSPQRRRKSSICNADAVFVRVDLFLTELKGRLDRLDRFRQAQIVQFDSQLERGYAALRDVRDSCSYASGELLWGVARHRAVVLVDTLEKQYNDVVPTRETLEQKAQASMKVMEAYLADIEGVVQARQNELSAAIDKGWRRIEEGYEQAKRAKEVLRESIAHALVLAKETRLISYDDLPLPWRGNPHILRGYRFTESKVECITSAFRPSNETVNIWSHLIGFFIVLALAVHVYPTSSIFQLSSKWDILIAAAFFTAACKCLICSAMWHTMNGIADDTLMARFACVDYTGISLLVAASIMSSEWTAFYCEPTSRAVYMTLTGVLGVLGSILPWRPTFNRADMAWARVAFYVTLAGTGFAPAVQLTLNRGSAWSYYFYAPIFKSVLVYLVGALVYALKIPEKWFPGFFDYAGGSHNIWHVAVLGGILFHYSAMQEFFNGAFRRAAEEGCALN